MAHELRVLRSTYGTRKDADAAGSRLIERRLAACVRVWPMESTYRWKGKLESGKEWLLEAHARPEDVDAVWDALLEGHPYDTPCVEVLAPVAVPARYRAWADRVTKR